MKGEQESQLPFRDCLFTPPGHTDQFIDQALIHVEEPLFDQGTCLQQKNMQSQEEGSASGACVGLIITCPYTSQS